MVATEVMYHVWQVNKTIILEQVTDKLVEIDISPSGIHHVLYSNCQTHRPLQYQQPQQHNLTSTWSYTYTTSPKCCAYFKVGCSILTHRGSDMAQDLLKTRPSWFPALWVEEEVVRRMWLKVLSSLFFWFTDSHITSANWIVTWSAVLLLHSFVYRVNKTGELLLPCRAPVLVMGRLHHLHTLIGQSESTLHIWWRKALGGCVGKAWRWGQINVIPGLSHRILLVAFAIQCIQYILIFTVQKGPVSLCYLRDNTQPS